MFIYIRARLTDDVWANSTTFVLHEHPQDRSLCPVSYFLALALSDEVFQHISNSSQFGSLDVPEGREHLCVPYKEDKVDLSIVRSVAQNGSVSPSRICSVSRLGSELSQLGLRAGYNQKLYSYSFRRGQAQKVDGKLTISKSIADAHHL